MTRHESAAPDINSLEVPTIDPAMQAVLIGGGQAYARGASWEASRPLLDLGLEMSGRQKPNVLVIPSARWKSKIIYNKLAEGLCDYFEDRGATAGTLHPYLFETDKDGKTTGDMQILEEVRPSAEELEDKTESADVVFVPGGDTNHMLNKVWRPLGIDDMLIKAMRRGAVITGSSAGTVAWFSGGHSDGDSLQTRKDPEAPSQFHYMKGLGSITETVVCPHYDAMVGDRSRKKSFKDLMYRRRGLRELGLGIENNTALQITTGGMVAVVRGETDGSGKIHSLHYRNGSLSNEPLTPADGQLSLEELVR